MHRRTYLRALAGGAVLGLAAGSASATHATTVRDDVTISFDRSWLETYQPRLTMPTESRDKLDATYAWRASSDEFDGDVGCYWTAYSHQEGVSQYDSHHGDHEPVYVRVDDSGEVAEVAASVYHWLRGRTAQPTLYDDTHPHLRVIDPWHHYSVTSSDRGGIYPDLRSLGSGDELESADTTTEFEAWLQNGLEADLASGVVTTPWRMLGADGRQHWWSDDAFGASFQATRLSIYRSLGVGTAGSLEA